MVWFIKVWDWLKSLAKEAVWASLVILLICWLFFCFIYVGEWFMPARYWFSYESVKPVKSSYQRWEAISMISKMERKRAIRIQRQDFMECEVDWVKQKLKTQYRPAIGSEYSPKGMYITPREYNLEIPTLATKCRMKGSAIGKTKHNFSKIYEYETVPFLVNQP